MHASAVPVVPATTQIAHGGEPVPELDVLAVTVHGRRTADGPIPAIGIRSAEIDVLPIEFPIVLFVIDGISCISNSVSVPGSVFIYVLPIDMCSSSVLL